MTSTDKVKKKKNKKSQKSKKNKTEVLEKVMDSIEMAGASMDFIESDETQSIEEPVSEPTEETLAAQEEAGGEISEPTEEVDEIEARAESSEDTELDAALSDGDELSAQEQGDELIVEEPSGEVEERQASADADEDDEENLDLLEDETREFVEHSQALSIIESLLFSSERPIGLGTFKQVFKGTTFKSKDIKKALEELQSEYASPARGVTLEEINGGWQLRTKVDNLDFLRKLGKAKPFKLSGPALEVMAIIAYKQPIVKSEIDEIRGVESGHLVRALMEKNLVNFQGKSELPGKPMQYGTTRKFLEIFGLRNLRELPSLDEIDQLLPDGIGIEEEDEKLSDVTDSMSEDYEGNYSEGEEELAKIEDTLEGIDTSSEFFEEEKRRQRDKRDRDRARDIREALDVGEEVEAKDVKWLERYDKKLEEEAEAARLEAEKAEAQENENVELADENLDALIASPESLTGELSKLTTENIVDAETMERDDELEASDEISEEQPVVLQEDTSEPTEEVLAASNLHPDNVIELSEPGDEDSDVLEAQLNSSDENESELNTFDPFSEEEDSEMDVKKEDEADL